MCFLQTNLSFKNTQYETSIHTPENHNSRTGIILAHGGYVNRYSLSRNQDSLGSYLCKNLNAYVFTPDLIGLKTDNNHPFTVSSEILSNTVNVLSEKFDLDMVFGFGHSIGCYSLAQAVKMNGKIDALTLFGGPVRYHSKHANKILVALLNVIKYFKKSVNAKRFIKHAYSEDTFDYFFDVMMRSDVYGECDYYFDFDLNKIYEIGVFLDEYVSCLKNYGKEVLMLFGLRDKLCVSSRAIFCDGYFDDNIYVKHLEGVSHITPCMGGSELDKLSIVNDFFRHIKKKTNRCDFNRIDSQINEPEALAAAGYKIF